MKTGKRFRKARLWPSPRTERYHRRIDRAYGDYWRRTTVLTEPTPGYRIPASKHGRGRWRR